MMRSVAGGLLVVTTLTALAVGCTGTGPDEVATISADEFASAYVDLRLSALQTTDSHILPEERAEILTNHGLEETDLLEFIDIHGRDATFMQTVWDSVEARLGRASDSLNSIAAESPR